MQCDQNSDVLATRTTESRAGIDPIADTPEKAMLRSQVGALVKGICFHCLFILSILLLQLLRHCQGKCMIHVNGSLQELFTLNLKHKT